MMYSFEGVVNLRPEQNLAGASRKEPRDVLLKRTQYERRKREEERRRGDSVLFLQSCIRSYLSRKCTKNIERRLFDENESHCENIQLLKPLFRQFIYFFNPQNDLKRLDIICQKFLYYHNQILHNLDFDASLYFLIRKFMCIILRATQYTESLDICLQCLDVYTSVSNIRNKIDIWPHLVPNGYFKQLRYLLDSNFYTEKTLSLINRPLLVVNRMAQPQDVKIIFTEFCHNFLCPDLSQAIKNHLIPFLIFANKFPYIELIRFLKLNRNIQFTHNLLYFVLVLEPASFEPTLDSIEVLASLSTYLKNVYYVIDLTNEDSDDEEEMMETSNNQLSLNDLLMLINHHDRVKKICSFFDQNHENEELLWSLTLVCHSLLLSSNLSITRHMLVYTLALRRSFLHRLWVSIQARQTKETMSEQFVTSFSVWTTLQTLVAVFCNMFCLYTSVLTDRDAPSASEIFTNQDLCSICTVLKKLSLNLIDVAFPMCRTSVLKVTPQLLHLYKSSLKALRILHTLDLRKHFTTEGFWTKTNIHISPDLSRRNYLAMVLRPFNGTVNDNEEEMLPPLLTMEQRSLTILQELPFLVDFQSRLLILRDLCKSSVYSITNGFPHREFHESAIVIRRTHLYEDAYEKLSPENEPNLRQKIRIQFINNVGLEEPGIDGGGIFKEFICDVLKTAFNPNRGFFLLTNDNALYPNPNVQSLVKNYVSHYYFIGRMLGKALFENILVDLPLADFFLAKLLNEKVDAHHLISMDPLLYRNILYMRDYPGDATDLELDFTVTCDNFGTTKIIDLKPNGSNIPVTNYNRFEYFLLLTDFKLNKQIKAQCTAFRNGLDSVMPLLWLKLFNHCELQVIIGGDIQEMNMDDLRNHTTYGGEFTPDHPTILIFWKIFESFSQTHRKQLLKFVTSCSRPPLLGFKELSPPFCIQSAGTEDRMPTASTCLNLLKLPIITKEEVLRNKLLQAIEHQAGFELS